jgi:hypothetical protein
VVSVEKEVKLTSVSCLRILLATITFAFVIISLVKTFLMEMFILYSRIVFYKLYYLALSSFCSLQTTKIMRTTKSMEQGPS